MQMAKCEGIIPSVGKVGDRAPLIPIPWILRRGFCYEEISFQWFMPAHRLYFCIIQCQLTRQHSTLYTVKPSNLAALEVGDFACKIILAN